MYMPASKTKYFVLKNAVAGNPIRVKNEKPFRTGGASLESELCGVAETKPEARRIAGECSESPFEYGYNKEAMIPKDITIYRWRPEKDADYAWYANLE